MEKRHYRNGYYISGFPNRDQAVKEITNNENVETPETVPATVVHENAAEPIHVTTVVEETLATPTQDVVSTTAKKENETDHVAVKHPSQARPGIIEPDKKQAIGAGIAAALFFFLGMGGLVITGGSTGVGIFIGAAFVCFILCIVLASFLYPRETVVKAPKEKPNDVPTADKTVIGIGLILLLVSALAVLGLAAWFFIGLTSLFF